MINTILAYGYCMLAITLFNLGMINNCTVEEFRKLNKYTIVIILIGIVISLILREVRS